MIGMRDLTLANYQFEAESEYVSIPFVSERPIREVSCSLHTYIPSEFGEGTWVEAFVTFDKGKTWLPILSQDDYYHEGKHKYIINSRTPREAWEEDVGYVETIEPVYELQFRLLLKRPNEIHNAMYYTPIVEGYEVFIIQEEG
jgi:hypothetical protein